MDILLLAEMGRIDGHRLREALSSAFLARRIHPLPTQVPELQRSWERPFQRLAAEVKLEQSLLKKADAAMQAFLNPALRGNELASGIRFSGYGSNVSGYPPGRMLSGNRIAQKEKMLCRK